MEFGSLFSIMWSQGHLAEPYLGCSERNSKNYKAHNVMSDLCVWNHTGSGIYNFTFV